MDKATYMNIVYCAFAIAIMFKMDSEIVPIGDVNEMTLRGGLSYPTHSGGNDKEMEQLEFEVIAPPERQESEEHSRQPRQIEAAAALGAVEAFEFLAEATAAEIVPVMVHEAAVDTAATALEAVPAATPATGLLKAGEVAAVVVPAAVPALMVPPVAVGIEPPPAQEAQPTNAAEDPTPLVDEDMAPATAPPTGGPGFGGAPRKRPVAHPTPIAKRARDVARSGTVKFGDHTIETTDVDDKPIYSLKSPATGSPDYITIGGPLVANSPDNFAVVDNTYRVVSTINPVTTQNALGAGVAQHCEVFRSFPTPIAAANRHICEVNWLSAVRTGSVSEVELTAFYQGGAVSSRYVASMLQPVLRPSSTIWLNSVSGLIRNKLTFHDNRAMYAKLMTYALTLELCGQAGFQTTPEAWPADDLVSYINLDDANLTVTSIQTPVDRGDIILIEGEDWNRSELLVTHWLSCSGFRVDGAEGHITGQACYIQWPGIRVCILRHGGAIARPAAALPTPQAIYQFAQNLADFRREKDALLAGIYIAMELVGVQYHQVGNIWYPCTSNFNTAAVELPAPVDYNFMLRVAKVYPKENPAFFPEVQTFSDIGAQNRVRLAALYNASISAFTTTALFSMSITCRDVINWCNNTAPRSFATTIMQAGITAPRGGHVVEAVPYFLPKLAIKHYLGLTPLVNLYPGARWNGVAGATPDAENAYHDMHLDHTPRFGTVLSIDNFLLVRPQEWCVLGPHTKIDITAELRANVSNALSRGVFTYNGAKAYSERVSGGAPYLFVPYGLQMINAIHQYLLYPAAALHYNAAPWSYRAGSDWTLAQPAQDVLYNAELHIIEPCTYASFSFGMQEVWAPCLAGNDLDEMNRRRLSAWRGGLTDYVGYSLFLASRNDLGPLEPPPIEAFGNLAMFDGPARAEGEASTSEPALN